MLLNEVDENLLLFRHPNLDSLDTATTGMGFLLDSNDGFSRIPCVGNFDDHAMDRSEDTSHWIVLEFVTLNENIASN